MCASIIIDQNLCSKTYTSFVLGLGLVRFVERANDNPQILAGTGD